MAFAGSDSRTENAAALHEYIIPLYNYSKPKHREVVQELLSACSKGLKANGDLNMEYFIHIDQHKKKVFHLYYHICLS